MTIKILIRQMSILSSADSLSAATIRGLVPMIRTFLPLTIMNSDASLWDRILGIVLPIQRAKQQDVIDSIPKLEVQKTKLGNG